VPASRGVEPAMLRGIEPFPTGGETKSDLLTEYLSLHRLSVGILSRGPGLATLASKASVNFLVRPQNSSDCRHP